MTKRLFYVAAQINNVAMSTPSIEDERDDVTCIRGRGDVRVQVRRYICGHLAQFLRIKTVSSSFQNDVTRGDVIHLPACHQQSKSTGQQSGKTLRGHRQQSGHENPLLSVERNHVSALEWVDIQNEDNSSWSTCDVLHNIRDLLETRLRSDTELRRQTDKNQKMMSEWITAAAVVDRICFIIFSLCLLLGTIVLFAIATLADQ